MTDGEQLDHLDIATIEAWTAKHEAKLSEPEMVLFGFKSVLTEAERRERYEDKKGMIECVRNSRQKAKCDNCGEAFEFFEKIFNHYGDEPDKLYWSIREAWLQPNLCFHCLKSQILRQQREDRLDRFYDLNPGAHHYLRATDKPRRPKQHAMAMQWADQHTRERSERGLVLHGSTGTGKTTTLYMLMAQTAQDTGLTCKIVNAVEVCGQISTDAMEGSRETVGKLRGYAVLAFDDIDKARMTARVASELFGILEGRISNSKPTLFTTNVDGDKLATMFPDNIGPAFVRRLCDFSETIDFDK